jgi:SM-20-related protein
MLNPDFFAHFGMYVARGFLGPEICSKLRCEARSAAATPATVWDSDYRFVVDEDIRKTRVARVSEAANDLVKAPLMALKPTLDRHFDVVTTGYRKPQFLIYRLGDFFNPHPDNVQEPGATGVVTGRRVSVVIFLNSEAQEPGPDCYGGGSLTFFGLMDDPRMSDYGFPLAGEEGMLVAFRPEIIHAVTPVTHGERYTVVTWLEV